MGVGVGGRSACSQSLMVRSSSGSVDAAVQTVAPSGVTTTALTNPVWPLRVIMGAPSASRQTRIVVSIEPEYLLLRKRECAIGSQTESCSVPYCVPDWGSGPMRTRILLVETRTPRRD